MYTHTSQTRWSITLLSAGAAAALLLTGLGLSNVMAASLTWDPGQSASGGNNGSGNWNSSGAYWYNGTANQAWANGDAAVFGTGTGGSGTYTVTVGSSGYTTSTLSTSNSGNTYVLTGGSINTGTAALLVDGNLTLQNITLTVGSTGNTKSSPTGISQASGATLVVGNGASLKTSYIAAGNELVGNTTGNATGTIDVNSGGYLGGTASGGRIQIDYSPYASGSAINVNGGTVNLPGSSAELWLSDAPSGTNPTGTLTVGADNTGGTVTVNKINTSGSGTGQTGILNIDSGTVNVTTSTGSITSSGPSSGPGSTTDVNVNGGTLNTVQITSANTGSNTNLTVNGGKVIATNGNGSISSGAGDTTTVNLNGGILSVHDITETGSTTAATGNTVVNFNGGTLQENNASVGIVGNPSSTTTYTPTNLNVMTGGAVIDTNGYSPSIYNPLLTGTSAGTPDGGLTVENTDPSRGSVSIASNGALTITGGLLTITGVNTYPGPTVINTGSGLQLDDHITTTSSGGATGAATIANTSVLQINSGGALILNPDGVGTQISVGGLNMNSGILDLGFDGGSFQSLLVGSTAAISGTNTILLAALVTTTAVPNGTYTLIADAAGGLTGTFEFANGSTTGTLTVGNNTYIGTLNNSATAETLTVSAVPEPATLGLLALSSLGLLLLRRRRDIGRIV